MNAKVQCDKCGEWEPYQPPGTHTCAKCKREQHKAMLRDLREHIDAVIKGRGDLLELAYALHRASKDLGLDCEKRGGPPPAPEKMKHDRWGSL